MISLPNDIKEVGYKKVSPFQYEQVFYSKSKQFTGTEKEFLKAGHGYKYIQISEFRRFIVK